jgi:hypothetical protein
VSSYSVVYTSTPSGSASDGTIDDILASARRNNPQVGVSGALLIADGRFVQVLEGERADVEATFDRISQDARHSNIEVLCRQTSSKPRFSQWSMAYVGETPTLLERYAGAPLAELARHRSGDALLDFMLDIARDPADSQT